MAEEIVRILSIDGGGIRGIISARILQRIEEAAGRPASELFHLIAGTSTGGIIGCGLARGKSAAEMAALYADHGADIFHRSLWEKVTTIDGLGEPDYDAAPLEAILAEQLGGTWLSEVHGAELLVTSYAIQLPYEEAGAGLGILYPRAPYLFKSWKAKGSPIDPGDVPERLNFRLRDVARATSAAPTYFAPALIRNQRGEQFGMIDGGVFANNPAMCALVAAYRLFAGAQSFIVVSLGTGALERPIPYAEAKDWGLVHWARPLLNVLFDGSADTVAYEVGQMPGVRQYRFDIALGMSARQDPDGVDEDFDAASPDNIRRIEGKARALADGMAGPLASVIDELRKPKWLPPAPR
jgi:predicted acylesterase/phospholipase RssA